jgi:hypothetical protein
MTVKVNYFCFGEFGTMKPNTYKTVFEGQLNKLCEQTFLNCVVRIFKSNDCTGYQIGLLTLDTKKDIQDNFQSEKNYSMTVFYKLNMATLSEALK